MIIRVTGGWVLIALFLVGLPLAAWWVGGRSRFWSRAEARQMPELELREQMARQHGLSAAEADQVERAVFQGSGLDEPRLRAAVVDWAQRRVDADRRRREARPGLRGWLVLLGVVWATGVVGWVAFAVARGRWGDVNWFSMTLYGFLAFRAWRRATAPARAIALNSDAPAS